MLDCIDWEVAKSLLFDPPEALWTAACPSWHVTAHPALEWGGLDGFPQSHCLPSVIQQRQLLSLSFLCPVLGGNSM